VDSPYACFRASAAASDTLPPDAVAKLLDDEESEVRTAMARSAPHLVDPATAEHIDRTFSPAKRMAWRPADDLTVPPETLRRLAMDPDPRMRCLAPRDPDLPAELAERLAHDPEPSVRGEVAAHRNLPTPALTELLADESEWVAEAAARSPFLPVEHMERLLALADL
jgi:phosphopantothenoylcysteine synthetase/decarboxylase